MITRYQILCTSRYTCLSLTCALLITTRPCSAQSDQSTRPLMAYVGTYSSPLRDVLPTQVDLPPGNGRGIHFFQVDRNTGALMESGVFELGTSPSCLAISRDGTHMYSANETARV